MKRRYIRPEIKSIQINANTLLAGSSLLWDKDAQAGLNQNPGIQGDFW